MPRTIKPENWQALADTLADTFGKHWMPATVDAIRRGQPTETNLNAVVKYARYIGHTTYNGHARAMCKSIAETLLNYGLVSRETVRDLLPE